ncbi:WbqC family protein [Shimia isoporae]|nr:WbqC family protein [Shimia isoporae]
MQPYLFPYIGYFQLMAEVDEFWLLDTVQFIRRGWMNRNNLNSATGKKLFTIPTAQADRDAPITAISYAPDAGRAVKKLCATVGHTYASAPFKNQVLEILESVQTALEASNAGPDFTDVTELALQKCAHRIGIKTPIQRVSQLGLDATLSAQDRIVAACREIGARQYLNMIGGSDLYDAETFEQAGIELLFLEPALQHYDQGSSDFLPGLSILDAIAYVSPDAFPELISAGNVVKSGV